MIVIDDIGLHWNLKHELGTGGFGRIYTCIQKNNTEPKIHFDFPKQSLQQNEHKDSDILGEENTKLKTTDFLEQIQVVAKVQNISDPQLEIERIVYKTLENKSINIPIFISGGTTLTTRFIIIERFSIDLRKLIQYKRNISKEILFNIITHIIQGLQYLHNYGYAHCDIKNSNILINPTKICIADFGLVTLLHPHQKNLCEQSKNIRFEAKCNQLSIQRNLLHSDCEYSTKCLENTSLKNFPTQLLHKHRGTIKYISEDAHRGNPITIISDLENLGYVILGLFTKLPWDHLINKQLILIEKQKFKKQLFAARSTAEHKLKKILGSQSHTRIFNYFDKLKVESGFSTDPSFANEDLQPGLHHNETESEIECENETSTSPYLYCEKQPPADGAVKCSRARSNSQHKKSVDDLVKNSQLYIDLVNIFKTQLSDYDFFNLLKNLIFNHDS